MSDVTIPQLEAQIENAKQVVAQRDQVSRLSQNPDFQKLVIEGFLKEECARFTHMSTDRNLSKDDREDALGYAQAAGYFKRWLNMLIVQGNRAAQDIVEASETIDEMRQAGDDE